MLSSIKRDAFVHSRVCLNIETKHKSHFGLNTNILELIVKLKLLGQGAVGARQLDEHQQFFIALRHKNMNRFLVIYESQKNVETQIKVKPFHPSIKDCWISMATIPYIRFHRQQTRRKI